MNQHLGYQVSKVYADQLISKLNDCVMDGLGLGRWQCDGSYSGDTDNVEV